MNFKRADRVGELIMAEMSDILLKEVKDPRLHAVTITAVKVTDDLRNAKIYFVEMGKDDLSADIEAGLSRAKGFVRKELGATSATSFCSGNHVYSRQVLRLRQPHRSVAGSDCQTGRGTWLRK